MADILKLKTDERASPSNVLRKVPPGRPKNADVRSREHLLPDEVEALMKAAGRVGRHQHRDKTLILTMYRHGLRVSEATDLKWDQIDLKSGRIHVNRLKNGNPSVHYLEGDELRALRKLQREYPESRFVFVHGRGGPMSRSNINKLVTRAGERAGLAFPCHPHMLRHSTGYFLANRGTDTRTIQDYLGHRSIQNTVKYTALSASKFKDLWG